MMNYKIHRRSTRGLHECVSEDKSVEMDQHFFVQDIGV